MIQSKIPRLRFPEFRDAEEWEPRELGRIGEFVGGGTPDTSVPEYWGGDILWFTPTEIKERYLSKSKRTITIKGLSNSSATLLPKGTLLISTRATIGDIGIANNPCATNQGFQSLIVHEDEVNLFWYYWFLQHKNELINRSSGSTFLEINKAELNRIPTLRPDKSEQQKIAACLSSLDDLIDAQAWKLNDLGSYKKGLMQQLFPQEGENIPRIRFPEFGDAGPWKMKRLGKIASFSKGKGISKSDVVDGGKLPCIRYGELYTHYGEMIEEIISYTNISKENLVLSKKNDVIIPASGETQEDIAKASCIERSGIALGGDLNIIRSQADGAFLSYYLNSAKKNDIATMAQGISVIHLYPNQLRNLVVSLPRKSEQRKIAACLKSADQLINTTAQQLEALKQHKNALMQQLFPAV